MEYGLALPAPALEIAGVTVLANRRHVSRDRPPSPDLPRIVAFRNRLIHGYSVIDHDVVWNTATTDLPALRKRLDELLSED